MSENKESKAMRFFEEKGFYIVLSLCVIAIGTAAYVLFMAPSPSEPLQNDPVMAYTNTTAVNWQEPGEDTPVAGLDVYGTAKQPSQTTKKSTTAASTAATTKQTTQTVVSTAKTAKTTASSQAVKKSADFFIRPVSGEIYQNFSGNELVYDRTNGDWRTHNGVDFLCTDGEKIMAVADGTIKDIYTDDYYGTSILVDHGDGLQSIYLGLLPEPSVYLEQEVSAGDIIGAVNTDALFESSLPVHFHLEMMKDGERIDPLDIIEK